MSLDVWLEEKRPCQVYGRNITHNLNGMAGEAGIYHHLWRPDELGIKTAFELIAPLRAGLALLEAPTRGWLTSFASTWQRASSTPMFVWFGSVFVGLGLIALAAYLIRSLMS